MGSVPIVLMVALRSTAPLKVLRQAFQTLENRSDLNSNVWNFKLRREVPRSGTWGRCRLFRVELEEVGDDFGTLDKVTKKYFSSLLLFSRIHWPLAVLATSIYIPFENNHCRITTNAIMI